MRQRDLGTAAPITEALLDLRVRFDRDVDVYSSGSSERYESGTMDQLDIRRMVKLTTQT